MSGRRRGSEVPPVVLDTNVVLSALVFGSGATGRLKTVWQSGGCQPLVSTATALELTRVLAYPKFRLDAVDREELLADYLPYCRVVRVPDRAPPVPECRDPSDLPFLHLAVVGRANALVTGDRDLLVLSDRVQFQILTPDAFLEGLPQP